MKLVDYLNALTRDIELRCLFIYLDRSDLYPANKTSKPDREITSIME